MPEPYSAQWAYLPAINRSAEALSPAEEEAIIRTILMFILNFTISEVHSVHSSYSNYIIQGVLYSPDSGLLVLVDCSVSGRLLHPPVSLRQQRRSDPAAPLL